MTKDCLPSSPSHPLLLNLSPTGTPRGPRPHSLGAIVGSFKAAVTKRINQYRGTHGMLIWQRGFYDHIIRDQESLDRIRHYIADNPARWAFDRENPVAIAPRGGAVGACNGSRRSCTELVVEEATLA